MNRPWCGSKEARRIDLQPGVPITVPSTVEGRTVMSVIIGIDPHKALHAACAIDRHRGRAGRVAGAHRTASTRPSCWPGRRRSSVERGRSSPRAGSAICSPSSSSLAASMSSMCRRRCRRGCGVLGSGRSNKNDANDARAVAVAALRSPSSPAVRVEDHVTRVAPVGQGTARHRHVPAAAPAAGCTLSVRELVAGGIRKEIVVSTSRSGPRRDRAGQRARNVNDSSSPTRRSTRSASSTHG